MPAPVGRLTPLAKAAVLGLSVAIAGVAVGLLRPVSDLEESAGLSLLFKLRGARQPPADVVVVAIDKRAADRLGQPADPARWPRSLHASLTETLAARGAAVVVFDLLFDQPRDPREDRLFADAVARAGNVVLAQHLSRETVPLAAGTGRVEKQATVERLVSPFPELADSALALAPFPLPKVPVRLSQYWLFKVGAGDAPTLPVVALQVFALDLYGSLLRSFERVSPYLAERLPRDREAIVAGGHAERAVRLLREVLQHDPAAAGRLLDELRASPPGSLGPRARRILEALAAMYDGPAHRYLNFYGPPRTLTTIPYDQVAGADPGTGVSAALPELRGKAVFVGLSEELQSRQRDGFYTVFSQSSGADLSGVEIAATAFANLLEATPVQPVPPVAHVAVLFIWGLAVGALCRLAPPLVAAPGLVALGGLYAVGAGQQFGSAGRWWPLVVPLLLQAPLAFVGATLWRYADTRRERENLRTAIGLYLPPRVADQVAGRLAAATSGGQLTYGTCLSTDAHQYTALAESMDPKALGALMNRYYGAIFEPVRRHGGTVLDVVGDSMLAIWTSEGPDAVPRRAACVAALEIVGAVERFERAPAGPRLPTRIGLHAGQLLLGSIGAVDHYEYRAVGDIVNIATRLEGLNKHLGTRVLVTPDVLEGLEGFVSRELGAFLLAGKSKPVVVHELLGRQADATSRELGLCTAFAEALAAYRDGAWKEACELFQECTRAHGEDGPSRFYERLCEQYVEVPPGDAWDPVVRMDRK